MLKPSPLLKFALTEGGIMSRMETIKRSEMDNLFRETLPLARRWDVIENTTGKVVCYHGDMATSHDCADTKQDAAYDAGTEHSYGVKMRTS